MRGNYTAKTILILLGNNVKDIRAVRVITSESENVMLINIIVNPDSSLIDKETDREFV